MPSLLLAAFAFIFLETGTGTMNSDAIKTEYDTYEFIQTLDSFVKLEEKSEDGTDYEDDDKTISENDIKTRKRASEAAFPESIDEKITGNNDRDEYAVVEGEYNRCSVCRVTFRYDRQYAEHCEGMHGNVRPYACNFCPRAFRIKIRLISHERTVHSKGERNPNLFIRKCNAPVLCDICGTRFLGYKAFEKHAFSEHEGVKTIPCPRCPKKYRSRKTALQHIRREHDSHPSLKCRFCQNIFDRSDLLQYHEMDCERRQTEKRKGNTVLRYEKGSKWRKIRCDECGEDDFKTFTVLRDHYKLRHPSVKLHPCDYCKEEFGNKITLEKHLDMRHADKQEDIKVWKKYRKGCNYPCVHCDGKFIRGLKAYEKHGSEEHEGKPMWFCQECDRGFTKRRSVRSHSLNVHGGGDDDDDADGKIKKSRKSKACQHCRQLYYRVDHLKKHEIYCGKKQSDKA